MAKSLLQLLACTALSLQGVCSIDTVDELIVSKYLGRWYQAYGNAYTAQTITRDSTCIAADYGLDEATGNITVINSDREHIPTGELNTITGYAYGTDISQPGKLKVHLGQVPVDGDYWVVGLGPATFGPGGAYEWAIVSGPEAESLFVLVRDVPRFEAMFAPGVLALVKDLGFTGPTKEPQRIVQENCLPFDPTTVAPRKEKLGWADFLASFKWDEDAEAAYANDEDLNVGAEGKLSGWADFLAYMGSELLSGDMSEVYESEMASERFHDKIERIRDVQPVLSMADVDLEVWDPVVPVEALDVDRYTGRWYQVYSSLTVSTLLEQNGACVTADYATQDDGSISITNTARVTGVDGELIEIKGYAFVEDESAPGKLKVRLDGMPVDAPYWVVALGDEDGDGPYPWAIVSDPIRAFLFVLVRSPEAFFGSADEADLLAKCKELGFTSFWNTPKETLQEGCEYTTNPAAPPADEVTGASLKLSEALKLRGGSMGLKGPLHASCKMTVKFPKNGCDVVEGALITAAEGMQGFEKCNGGNKCGYTVSHVTSGTANFVHETSVKHYKDDLTFTLTDNGDSCEATAFSTSQTWYAVLDNSVNYCNLHNLVDACGLDYEETDVSDATCTQYSSADCERY